MFVFLLLNLFAVFIYCVIPKKVSRFQIVGAWLITVIYHDEWLTITSVNLDLIQTTQQTGEALVIGLNRMLLYPLCSLFFLELYTRARTWLQKSALYGIGIVSTLVLQYANQWFGLYSHRGWAAWWSIFVWGGCLLLLIVSNNWFISLLKKAEGN